MEVRVSGTGEVTIKFKLVETGDKEDMFSKEESIIELKSIITGCLEEEDFEVEITSFHLDDFIVEDI